MKLIKFNDYCFKIKWGKKYIWPGSNYREDYYTKQDISAVIDEIETEFPRYKGKVVVFRRCLLKEMKCQK